MNRRKYQKVVVDEFVSSEQRFWALLWERQAGKSTTLADFALYEMMHSPHRTVIYASASLLLSQEITLKTAIRTDQSISELIEGDAAALKHFADTASSSISARLKTFDSVTGKEIIGGRGAHAKQISAAG